MDRIEKFEIVRLNMHKDYSNSWGILVCRNGATTLVGESSITDDELQERYEVALIKIDRRKTRT
ncbi:MAG: hypothetical protein GY793_07210 [Proteobacteria bacterium]|nr:hypothetical protein [Pseudomonadota bacterium]